MILFFIPLKNFSQNHLDFGQVNGQVDSACKYGDGNKSVQKETKLYIHLIQASMLIGRYWQATLSFNGISWKAMHYNGDWIHNTIDSFEVYPLFSYDSVFQILKNNNIFTLPNQNELKNVKGSVDDGSEYRLYFEAGCKSREYEFNNPSIYQKSNKDISEFSNYVNIVDLLFKGFKKIR